MLKWFAALFNGFDSELLWQPEPKWCSVCGVRVCFDYWFSSRANLAAQCLDAEKLYEGFNACLACSASAGV